MRISDWSSDVCSSYLLQHEGRTQLQAGFFPNAAGPMPLLGDAKAARRGGQHQQGARTARQLGKRLGDAPIEVAIIAIVTPILLRAVRQRCGEAHPLDRKSTRLNSSH